MSADGNGAGALLERRDRRRRKSPAQVRLEDGEEFKKIQLTAEVSALAGILNPYFLCHEGLAKDTTIIDGRQYLNFSTYDYLNINGHERIRAAVDEAVGRYGTSAGASRLVAGERPPHQLLERALADLTGAEAALVFVGGYTTNATVISHLMGPQDLIIHDALSHNSLIMGAIFSGAARFSYPHNDLESLEQYLADNRDKYQKAIIVTEGIFSMDGTIAPLDRLVTIKERHRCFLMVDEAHSIGVLGATGRGVTEYYGIPVSAIDIQMGTLSKAFCGCGGFITGSEDLITYMRYTAPGFLYSVGMSPPLAVACRTALEIMLEEPQRVARLHELGRCFLAEAGARGLNTGESAGFGVVPVIVGSSLVAGYLTTAMFENGVNVLPIIHPVVEEGTARLRFFISAAHQEEQISRVLDLIVREAPVAEKKAQDFLDTALAVDP